ncbi:MAG: zinc ABC transporter substrate-binding protein [Bacteroidaceae bacterium]|nr:zinc ABC transporter substrate-binding protein [Bacteroidaceae bacterium]
MLLILLSGCAPKEQQKKTLVVSIEPLRYFAEQIAGDRYNVVSIVPEGYSPETYEPSPHQLLTLSSAQAYLKVGQLGFETTWLPKMISNVPQLPVIDTSQGLPDVAFDPHTWTSPRSALLICRNICTALCQSDTAYATHFRANLHRLENKIRTTEHSVDSLLSQTHVRTFVTVHPMFSRLAADYGLKQLSIEHNGKEPTPSRLAQLCREAQQEGVRCVLVIPEFGEEHAAVIARESEAKLFTIHPLSYQWDQEIIHTARAIAYE